MREKAQRQNQTELLFKFTSPMSPLQSAHGEQGLPQGWSVDHANKSRPVTCSIAPFEGQASSVRKKKARRALFSLRVQGGKEGKESRHLLPWLLAKYEDPAIQKAPFSCSQPANVTRSEGRQHRRRPAASFNALMIRARAAQQRKEKWWRIEGRLYVTWLHNIAVIIYYYF